MDWGKSNRLFLNTSLPSNAQNGGLISTLEERRRGGGPSSLWRFFLTALAVFLSAIPYLLLIGLVNYCFLYELVKYIPLADAKLLLLRTSNQPLPTYSQLSTNPSFSSNSAPCGTRHRRLRSEEDGLKWVFERPSYARLNPGSGGLQKSLNLSACLPVYLSRLTERHFVWSSLLRHPIWLNLSLTSQRLIYLQSISVDLLLYNYEYGYVYGT